ncbi:MAG: exodeoxyribonuclease VII small subunit [Planctomycetaceae bacterium]|nr:exodeoxyribonuclease VII small subunit [Planctomycetaceae bacterium]
MAKKKVKKKPAAAAEAPSFEDALAELEQIVARLEGGQLPLADALSQYELGVRRLQTCYQLLTDAERRIELVAKIDPQGRVEATDFDDAATADLADKAAARSGRRSAGAPRRGKGDDAGSTLF